jgi:hypothetical protein
VCGTPANLVISSGSTLGTTNGVQSDIVVLAINNAGTIELAAVNLAGGTDLSEINLVSTTAEGGAGAADSATVVYSATARSNLSYRVLGIIRSTQATAGTWATAPSLIQGIGGQALEALLTPQPQIQPVSASVAGNALTISASALTLDFRSTTLGSGTVTRVSGTPANLVISSGSTLGTVNAVQSDIAVLAMNNAGTLELAAVNLAGGTDLSETNLISTTAEGGAGAADSATVVYSTTARTNLAYRVIGIIRSTQATAGTWVTAPSLIQGAGGQAITAMSSIGYGQTWQDVTGSRAGATTYYNTTGKPIMLCILVSLNNGEDAVIVINGTNTFYANPFSGFTGEITLSLMAVVPPGQSYRLNFTGSIGILAWRELR